MAATDEFDLNGILSQLYRVGPTEDERRRAATQAMARMGLGILAANQPSATPRNPWGVLAQGGLGGMDAYQSEIQRQMQERKQNAIMGVQLQGVLSKQQKDRRIQDYAASLPEADRERFLVDPGAYLKATTELKAKPFQTGATRTITEGDQQVVQEHQADGTWKEIGRGPRFSTRESTRSPYFQFLPSEGGYLAGDTRTGTAAPVTIGGRPAVPAATSPTLQRDLAAAKAAGTESGKTTTQAQFNLPQVIASAEQSSKFIDELVGSKDMKTKPHPGFRSYVGFTLMPGMRFVEGSKEADFEARLKQITGGAFLEAFETLKGGGHITEIEGKKATDAVTRMSKSQSEAEFIKAARDYQNVIRDGVALAKARAGSGGQPSGGQSVPQGVDPALWEAMTPEERALWR